MKLNTDSALLQFSVMVLSLQNKEVLEIGEELVKMGYDDIIDEGFWIWDLDTDIQFYSPNFRKELGFSGEQDFPSVSSSLINVLPVGDLKNISQELEKAKEEDNPKGFKDVVRYQTKNKEVRYFVQSAKLLKVKGNFKYLVGTHKKEELV